MINFSVNNPRYGNSNPAFRDNNGGYSQQTQLLQEQDGQLELVSNNGTHQQKLLKFFKSVIR